MAKASLVDGDAAVFAGEHRHLLPPAEVIAAGAVQEQEGGRRAACVLVVEAKAAPFTMKAMAG